MAGGERSGARATSAAGWPSTCGARCCTRLISTMEPSRRSISRPSKSSSRPRSAAGPATWYWRATATLELLPNSFRLPSALERPHVVEELVIEMEVRELRVGQGNGGALDQDRNNLGRSRV